MIPAAAAEPEHARAGGGSPPQTGSSAPIGIFDSGFGGLTVARAVLDQLPHEAVLYLGDTLRQPYGPRPIAQVRAFALECLDSLVAEGVKVLVIACNSASAAVLHDARERYAPLPVVEVIRPAVRRAVAATRNGHVGVICTTATATSGAYADAFGAVPGIEVSTRACPDFVDFVEAGVTGGPELLSAAHRYLDPLAADGIDTLVLGCTHYPLLSAAIAYVMGEPVTLVSSAEETANDLYRLLTENSLAAAGGDPLSAAGRGDPLSAAGRGEPLSAAGRGEPLSAAGRGDGSGEPIHRFLTTGPPAEFTRLARRFLGPEVVAAQAVSMVRVNG